MSEINGKFPNGLESAMKKVGIGPTELARLIHNSKQNVTRWAKQSRALPPSVADQMAPHLKTTAAELLLVDTTPKTVQPLRKKIVRVPLLDTVTAGRLRSPSSQIPIEDVPLLAFADLGRGEWFALRVDDKGDGDSMNLVSPPGSIIIVNKADRELRNGKFYVFSIGGETTYKMWQDDEPPYLAPFSTNPIHKPILIKRKRDFEVIGRVKRTVLDL